MSYWEKGVGGAMTAKFEKLLEPRRIGSVTTRNRLIKTGASMCCCHTDHVHMSEKAKAYYGAVARGGVGLLIIESPVVDWPRGARWKERYRRGDRGCRRRRGRVAGGQRDLVDS